MGRILPIILILGLMLWIYQKWWAPEAPLTVKLITWDEELVPSQAKTPPLPGENDTPEVYDAALPSQDFLLETDPEAISNPLTLQEIADMILWVERDLRQGKFGDPNELSYNIVYLFQQSLAAYSRYLRAPQSGPDLYLLAHRGFSGRYKFRQERIQLGKQTLQNGEGRFLTTLFHEYQHHLFHTIYGTPDKSDIALKFYNELSAHIFEALFASYLPKRYFIRPHRKGRPQLIRQYLFDRDGRRAIEWIYDWMVPESKQKPIYSFLYPASDGFIAKEELLRTIDDSFQSDPEAADKLEEIALEYWGLD